MLRKPDLCGRALDGRYELQALIGEGAFGRVYRGVDLRLERPVAVKVIKPWWAEDSAWVERFQREAQMLARVSDPGIVQIYDIGHAEEGPYYVAELVDGESLAEKLRDGPLSWTEALEVAERLCTALASAHAQRIVHCDVKPANVLLSLDGKVKVGDFGVARLAEGTSQAPAATIAGTPRYMSPEQARGRPTSPATDVYSAGIVLYEMLAGNPPFEHGSVVELGLRHVQDEPPSLPATVPEGLREVVDRALAKAPSERYRDAAAMASALGDVSAPGAPTWMSESAGADGEEQTVQAGASENGETTVLLGDPATVVQAKPPDPATVVRATPATATVIQRRARIRGQGRGGTSSPPAGKRRTDVSPRRPRRMALLAGLLVAIVGLIVAGRVFLNTPRPGVRVPEVVGRPSATAESAIERAGLHYAVRLVAAPGSKPDAVTHQSPPPSAHVRPGSTVALHIAEAPRWRELTGFSGFDDGESVPLQILGGKWKIAYHMSYEGSCTLLLVCFGPSAEVEDLHTGSTFDSFELGEGESETHTFDSGPGLYRLKVSGGHDSAHWSMTVYDYY
jgi:eukaryotic-like serine/threonine-protein kinase